MSPKYAYSIFLTKREPVIFAKAIMSDVRYPPELRMYAEQYVADPVGFAKLCA